MLYYLGAFLAGAIIPLQTGVNTRLRNFVGSPFYASTVSFIFATITLAVLLLFPQAQPANPALQGVEPWQWAGGILGCIAITGNIFLLIKLGGVQAVVLPAAGQIIMGLIIDQFALFNMQGAPLTPLRIAGALLVIGSIVLISLSRDEEPSEPDEQGLNGQESGSNPTIWLWRGLGLLVGAATATQTAVNGSFGKTVGSPIYAAFLSCVVGVVALGILCVFLLIKTHGKIERKQGPAWWMFFGGSLGGTMILLNATMAALIGTGAEVVFALAGSISFGVLIDQFGLFGVEKKSMTETRALGLIVLFCGIMMVRMF